MASALEQLRFAYPEDTTNISLWVMSPNFGFWFYNNKGCRWEEFFTLYGAEVFAKPFVILFNELSDEHQLLVYEWLVS